MGLERVAVVEKLIGAWSSDQGTTDCSLEWSKDLPELVGAWSVEEILRNIER